MLLHLRKKRAEVMLRRVVPPLVSILTTIVGSHIVTHVFKVVKEKKMEKA